MRQCQESICWIGSSSLIKAVLIRTKVSNTCSPVYEVDHTWEGFLPACGGPDGTQLVVQRLGEAHGSGGNQVWRIHETVITAVGNEFSVRSARDLTLAPIGAEALRSAGSACGF